MSGAPTLFLALLLPLSAQQQLAPLLGQLGALDPRVKPARPEGLHLTLRFLGRVDPAAEEALRLVAAQVAAETVAFPLELQGLGVFGGARQPRVVWVDVGRGRVELGRLAAALDASLAGAGWSPDRQPFRAHCTLARVGEPLGAGARAALAQLRDQAGGEPALAMRADELVLLESVVVPGGPNRYPCRARWRLQEA